LLTLLEGLCSRTHRLPPAPEARDRTPNERKRYREERFRAHFRDGRKHLFRFDGLVGRDWLLRPLPAEPSMAPGTVVGLLDRQGFCLAVGLVEEVRPESVAVYTAGGDATAVARVQVGNLRLSRQGEELL